VDELNRLKELNWNKCEPVGYAYAIGAERERDAVDGEPAVLELKNRTTENRFEETADRAVGAGRLGAWIGRAMFAGGKPW